MAGMRAQALPDPLVPPLRDQVGVQLAEGGGERVRIAEREARAAPVLDARGLGGLESVTVRHGYDGAAQRTQIRLAMPGDRRGLLRPSQHKPFTIADLPKTGLKLDMSAAYPAAAPPGPAGRWLIERLKRCAGDAPKPPPAGPRPR